MLTMRGGERQRLDVGDGVDGGVPGDPVVGVGQRRRGPLGDDVGVLEPGVGKGLDDALVEDRVGLLVDDGPAVQRLEVDRVHGAGSAPAPR